MEDSKKYTFVRQGVTDTYEVRKASQLPSPKGVVDDARIVVVSRDLMKVILCLYAIAFVLHGVLIHNYIVTILTDLLHYLQGSPMRF
jgi:hypothetical protein